MHVIVTTLDKWDVMLVILINLLLKEDDESKACVVLCQIAKSFILLGQHCIFCADLPFICPCIC